MKLSSLFLVGLLYLTACAPTLTPTATTSPQFEENVAAPAGRHQEGNLSFENIEGFSIYTDGLGGVFIGSPDSEISVMLMYVSNSELPSQVILQEFGARYPEEAVPLDIIIFLGFGSTLQLGEIEEYHLGNYSGFSRTYVAASSVGDPMEGEYVFFSVDETHTFIAMGSVVRVTGDNQWDPQGKAAFDTIVGSVEFN